MIGREEDLNDLLKVEGIDKVFLHLSSSRNLQHYQHPIYNTTYHKLIPVLTIEDLLLFLQVFLQVFHSTIDLEGLTWKIEELVNDQSSSQHVQ